MKQYKRKFPILNFNYSILVYEDPAELTKMFPDYDFEPDPNSFDGGFFELNGRFYLAFLNDGKLTNGTIAHECKHMVNRFFTIIYQNLDPENDELECYFFRVFGGCCT